MNEQTDPLQNPGGPPSAGGPPPYGQGTPPYGPGAPAPGQAVPPPGPGTPPGSSSDRFFDALRRTGIVRTDDRWIAGVAGGIAQRFGIDPLLVRGLLALSLLLAGAGLVLYALAWALLPEQRDGRIHLQEAMRGNVDGALLGAAVMLIVGFTWDGMRVWPFAWMDGWLTALVWLGAVAAVGGLVIALAVRRPEGRAPGAYPGEPAWAPPAHGAARPGGPSAGPAAGPAPSDHTEAAAWGTGAMGATESVSTPPSGPGAPPAEPQGSGADAGAQRAAGPGSGGPGSGGPGSAGPGASGPEQHARPPTTTPRRTHGPGAVTTGIVLGAGALGLGGLLLAERLDLVSGPLWLIALGGLLVLTGLGIVVAGLRGRTSGWLGAVAVIAALLAAPAATVHSTEIHLGTAQRSIFSESTFRPTSMASAEDGYALAAGSWTVDLTGLPDGAGPVTVPISFTAGDLTVVVPADTPWVASTRLAAVTLESETQGPGRGRAAYRAPVLESDLVADGASPVLRVQINGLAGDATIIEEGS